VSWALARSAVEGVAAGVHHLDVGHDARAIPVGGQIRGAAGAGHGTGAGPRLAARGGRWPERLFSTSPKATRTCWRYCAVACLKRRQRIACNLPCCGRRQRLATTDARADGPGAAAQLNRVDRCHHSDIPPNRSASPPGKRRLWLTPILALAEASWRSACGHVGTALQQVRRQARRNLRWRRIPVWRCPRPD
jgi:hypothetical protein